MELTKKNAWTKNIEEKKMNKMKPVSFFLASPLSTLEVQLGLCFT